MRGLPEATFASNSAVKLSATFAAAGIASALLSAYASCCLP